MDNNDSITLYYRQGGSDKVYQAQIVPESDGTGFRVNFQFGRRGSTLSCGTKTQAPVPYEKARLLFDKLVGEKTAKGYGPGEEGTPYAFTSKEQRQTGVYPVLLTPVDGSEFEKLMRDDDWCAQEKFDGRRILLRKTGSTIEGINRLGLTVGIPKWIAGEVEHYSSDFLIDGEMVGETYHAFDLLELDGSDRRALAYWERRDLLSRVLSLCANEHVVKVETGYGSQKKAGMFAVLEERGAEGIVLRHNAAPYVPGRPESGGSNRKRKFYETASLMVAGVNEKRSAQIAAYSGDLETGGHWVSAGNVTIPPNHEVPRPGDFVEVRYLYCVAPPPAGSLFQPTYLGRRDDLTEKDCRVEQLKIKSDGNIKS